MRKNRIILTLMLVMVLMFSTVVVGCGNKGDTGDNNSTTKAANVEATKEATTAAVESTTPEATTSKEVVYNQDFKLDYSLHPISDETKAMLIDKLSNLQLVSEQEFHLNSLKFKEDEQVAYKNVKAMLTKVMSSPQSDNDILKCCVTKVELYKIESDDSSLKFYFKVSFKKK